jgi:hypothetical protein
MWRHQVILGRSGAHGRHGAAGVQGSALLRVHKVTNALPEVDKEEVDGLHRGRLHGCVDEQHD